MTAGSKRRGGALFVVLLMLLVLVCMAKSLTLLAVHGATRSRSVYQQTAALYLVEAAVARMQERLLEDPGSLEGFGSERLEDGPGTYTVRFGPGPNGSVNNLMGATAADGPRGPGTVPPGTADLVVLAEVESRSRRVEVLLGRGLGAPGLNALQAGGRVTLKSEVRVDGIAAYDSLDQLPGSLHSNFPNPIRDVISWDGSGTATITGKVSTVSDHPQAIDLADCRPEGGIHPGVAAQPLPAVDILGHIRNNSSQPAPNLNSGGLTRLGSGSFYSAGDVMLNGDLRLDGATLYVGGALRINGSLAGRGAVFVGGRTSLRGDSAIETNNPDGVALYSHGSVQLDGFDGTQFLDALAASDPDAARWWEQLQLTVHDLQTLIAASKLDDLLERFADPDHEARHTLNDIRRTLAQGEDRHSVYRGFDRDLLGQLAERVERLDSGPTRDFMVERLAFIRDLFLNDGEGDSREIAAEQEMCRRWLAGERVPGILDAACDSADRKVMTQLIRLVQQVDYNRLGSSHFQGVIYSHGSIRAAHEVTVVGALYTEDDGSQEAATVDGVTLEPGDVLLNSGTSLIFNEDYARNPGGPNSPVVALRVVAWLESVTHADRRSE